MDVYEHGHKQADTCWPVRSMQSWEPLIDKLKSFWSKSHLINNISRLWTTETTFLSHNNVRAFCSVILSLSIPIVDLWCYNFLDRPHFWEAYSRPATVDRRCRHLVHRHDKAPHHSNCVLTPRVVYCMILSFFVFILYIFTYSFDSVSYSSFWE